MLEVTDALVEVYAWPNKIPADAPSHGILENGIKYTAKAFETYVAPTDWSIYVQYSFGPYAAKIRT